MFTVKFHFYQDCPKCKNYHHLSLQPTVRWENPPLPVVEAAMIWSRNVLQGFICLRFCHVCFLGSFNTSHWVSTYITCLEKSSTIPIDTFPELCCLGVSGKMLVPTTMGFSIKKRMILGWRLGVPPFEGFPLLNLVQRNWRVLLGNSIRSHLHTT